MASQLDPVAARLEAAAGVPFSRVTVSLLLLCLSLCVLSTIIQKFLAYRVNILNVALAGFEYRIARDDLRTPEELPTASRATKSLATRCRSNTAALDFQ